MSQEIATTNLSSLREKKVSVSLDTSEGFNLLQRQAKMFQASSFLPKEFQGNLANICIALNIAIRLQADPLLVMQNLYVVHGKPAWSSAFLVAMFNKCGRYSSIHYEFDGQGDDYGCKAVCTEIATGRLIAGPRVSLRMARAEGWSTKAGSKWKTMPELMLRYRAAAFLIRTTAPEISFGIYTADEMRDVYDASSIDAPAPAPAPAPAVSVESSALADDIVILEQQQPQQQPQAESQPQEPEVIEVSDSEEVMQQSLTEPETETEVQDGIAQ